MPTSGIWNELVACARPRRRWQLEQLECRTGSDHPCRYTASSGPPVSGRWNYRQQLDSNLRLVIGDSRCHVSDPSGRGSCLRQPRIRRLGHRAEPDIDRSPTWHILLACAIVQRHGRGWSVVGAAKDLDIHRGAMRRCETGQFRQRNSPGPSQRPRRSAPCKDRDNHCLTRGGWLFRNGRPGTRTASRERWSTSEFSPVRMSRCHRSLAGLVRPRSDQRGQRGKNRGHWGA
jgi:hypothetical protein